MECATCHVPLKRAITARVGPISIPLCARCAEIARLGMKALHRLFG